jgi:uncharacterized surface protein with fasciclin (FAS1) repeats
LGSIVRLSLIAAVCALPLAGCGGGGEGSTNNTGTNANSAAAAAAAPSGNRNLIAALDGDGNLDRAHALVTAAGLTDALSGVGPYTLFAPTNAAIEALGRERADALASEQMRPQAAALVRAHIVPGTLTRRDLLAAVQAARGQPVRMRTMAGPMLTFTSEGTNVIVASDDGARARLTGNEAVASNGAVQPIDGLLRTAE